MQGGKCYQSSHLLELVLKRGVDRLSHQVGLNLAPLGAKADANHQTVALLTLSDQTGGQQKAILVTSLAKIIGLTSQ